MFEWEDELKVLLTTYIEEAVNKVDSKFMEKGRAVFPYLGDNTYRIMADAALAVLRGMADAEEFLRDDGMLKD